MSPTVKCCFEPENLVNASPATVSRAGIIYISDAELPWYPVLEALMNKATQDSDRDLDSVRIPQAIKDGIMPLFKAHVDKAWDFIRRDCKVIMHTRSCPGKRVAQLMPRKCKAGGKWPQGDV